jgi:hypothetical protein
LQIYTEAPTVPLLSLGEIPTLHLSNLDENAFDVDDLNFDIDNMQEWEDT